MPLRTVIDWIPLADRPPSEDQPCFLVANGHVLTGVGWWDGEWFTDEPFRKGRLVRRDVSHYCYANGLMATDHAGQDE